MEKQINQEDAGYECDNCNVEIVSLSNDGLCEDCFEEQAEEEAEKRKPKFLVITEEDGADINFSWIRAEDKGDAYEAMSDRYSESVNVILDSNEIKQLKKVLK